MIYYSTEKQMEKLDILAVKNGLLIRQMMELAGYHIINLFQELKISKKSKVTVVIGKGNKGGDGLCAARHLINYGFKVRVILISKKISPDALPHLKLLKKMKVNALIYQNNVKKAIRQIKNSDVFIDSLIGYHLKGAPRGHFKELIEIMNQSKKKIIAYDLPSGLEATKGKCFDPCIKAYATLTLALPKKAFKTKSGKLVSGKIYLGDIGIPDFLYNKIKKDSKPDFKKGLIKL